MDWSRASQMHDQSRNPLHIPRIHHRGRPLRNAKGLVPHHTDFWVHLKCVDWIYILRRYMSAQYQWSFLNAGRLKKELSFYVSEHEKVEAANYFDAHAVQVDRKMHDIRGCRAAGASSRYDMIMIRPRRGFT